MMLGLHFILQCQIPEFPSKSCKRQWKEAKSLIEKAQKTHY